MTFDYLYTGIIEQFLDWLDGGDAPPTVLADNIHSSAMLFGAIEASETGQTVERIEDDTTRNFWLEAKDAVEYGLVGKIIEHQTELPATV